MEKAVVDRIVDGKIAVILVGDDQREHHHPADELPEGAREGTWLRVQVESGSVVAMEVDQEETGATIRRLQEKMNKLRLRGRKTT